MQRISLKNVNRIPTSKQRGFISSPWSSPFSLPRYNSCLKISLRNKRRPSGRSVLQMTKKRVQKKALETYMRGNNNDPRGKSAMTEGFLFPEAFGMGTATTSTISIVILLEVEITQWSWTRE
ncbi:hypothetical protein BV898_14484 [Hypsibius exemplaris]|uniref:Uncharacterized protein n=1 Tax=Hypsibius exemplaris TaxID=2072580 RepID=A0A9X6N8P9_HYPEX|nr:hypothetical protein BV898_14484 [Hypsibius exemplaris]